MILSIYLSKEWLSAVLCRVDPIEIVDKVFLPIPVSKDKFYPIGSDDIWQAIINKIPDQKDNILSAKRILIVDDFDNAIDENVKQSLDHVYSFDQISQALGQRLFNSSLFDDFVNSLFDDELSAYLNQYKNCELYNLPLPDTISTKIVELKIKDYVKKRFDPKANLYEMIVACPFFSSTKEQNEFNKLVIKSLASAVQSPYVFEVTYDLGYFMSNIIAILLFTKQNIQKFFVQNPVQIDAKAIKIPGLGDDFEITLGDGSIDLEQVKQKSKNQFMVTGTHGDLLSIINKHQKINIQTDMVDDGVYLNTN